jgi:hypothetical protein
MHLGHLLTAIAAIALLLPAASFAAPGGSLPSDGSALDQYVESIPDGQGGRPSSGAGGGNESSSAGSVGGTLQGLGADGAAAARLAAATVPDAAPGAAGSEGSQGSGDGSDESGSQRSGVPGFRVEDPGGPGVGGGSAGETIATLLGDDRTEGLGVILPFILLAILVTALGTAAVRSRRARRAEKTP